MSRSLVRVAVGVLMLGLCAPALERAEAQTAAETERARRAFEEANAAADADRFAEARSLFEESLRILPRAATALNLAQVLSSLGELTESEQLVDRLLAGEYGAATATVRERAEALRAELVPRFAHLSLTLEGAEAASLRVDESPSAALSAGAPLELRVDPGTHLLRVSVADGRSLEREVRLGVGESRTVVLAIGAPLAAPSTDVRSGGEDFTWVIGLVVGVVVVGAGVGIGVGIATASPGTEQDPVWGSATALVRF